MTNKKNMRKKMNKKLIACMAILTLMVSLCAIPAPVADAAALTDMSATLSTLKQNTKANQEIMFTLSAGNGLQSSETIILTYDSDIDVTTALSVADIDFFFEATPDGVCGTASGDTEMALLGAPDSTSMGVVRTDGQIITFTNGSTVVAAGSEICIQIGTNAADGVQQIKNAVTAASDNLVISGTIGGADPETGTIVITSVTDDTVVTTATVPASLSFDIVGDETMGFGTLTTGASRWANTAETGETPAAVAHTLTASTNSTSGYTITVKGDTLKSTGTPGHTITAISPRAALNTDEVEQFGLNITSAGGTGVTVDTDYDNDPADEYYYGATANTADTIAVCTGLSATTTYSIKYAANIASTTEAHTDYTASLIYVATGNF